MGHGKRIILVGFLLSIIAISLVADPAEADSKVYYGRVVGIQLTTLQARADNGKISVFWLGYKTHLGSRLPFFGDRVKIEYVKDPLGRNAVTQIAVLKKL